MERAATHWLPGVLVLVIGGLAALAYLLFTRRKEPPVAIDGSADDAQARYETFVAQLRELNANQHLHTPEAFAEEKGRLEAAAAQALKARLELKHEAEKAQARAEAKAKAAAADTGFFARNPSLKGALIGGSVVALAFFLAKTVQEQSRPRDDQRPAPMAPRPDDRLEKAVAAAKAAPGDVDALANAGLALFRRQRFEEGASYIANATILDPFHVRARVGRAVMRAVNGDIATALVELEALAAKYPEAYDASLFAGMLAMEQNDRDRALYNFEGYLAAAGDEAPPMMRRAVEQLRMGR